VPGESVKFNECMHYHAGVLIPVTGAVGLGNMQGPSNVRGLSTRGAGAQDLVKSRTRAEAVHIPVQASLPFRVRLGCLEIARN